MRLLGLVIGALVILGSAISFAAPDLRLSLERSVITPAGLYAIAALRIAIVVFVLAAVTAPGDSGAPVVDAEGRVFGVMFAYDISRQTTAYALTRAELDAVLDPVVAGTAPAPSGTGACLSE